jgi:serine/threonine protein kinase
MGVKDKAIAFCQRFGKRSGLAAAKTGAKMALSALLPGGAVVVEVVELLLDCVHETAKDQLIFEDRPLPASADDLRRIEEMLATLTDDLAPFMERLVRLDNRRDEVDRVFAEAMETLDERGRNALHHIDHLARRFDVLEEQIKNLLQTQRFAPSLLAEWMPLMQRIGSVADYIDELRQAGISAADFSRCLQGFQEAARAFSAGQIAEASKRFQKSAELHPQSAAAATALAGVKVAEQDFLAAEQSIARAARLRPDDAELTELHRRVTVATGGATPRERSSSITESRQPVKVGDTLDGWRLDLLLGHGGWGRVFKASRCSEIRALKVMHPDLSRDPLFVERFKKEILTLAGLRGHKNLVAIDTFGYAAEAGCWYFVMELIEGMSLERYLQKRGVLTLAQARPLFLALADGLAAAHARGIIHRDIKPANILIRREGAPVLVDFGLAAVADDKGVTQSGRSAGYTAMFAAPEQLRGKLADTRSDIYSLAASLYHALLYDKPEHREPDQFEAEHVPEPLRDLLTVALHRKPERRPSDAAAFRDTLLSTRERIDPSALTTPRNTVDLSIPGKLWYRPVNDPDARWEQAAYTPGTITIHGDYGYRLSVQPEITDEQLAALANLCGLTTLQKLDFSCCKQLTDAGLAHLRGLTNLQSLDLHGCEKLTGAGLAHLRGITKLQELILSSCLQLTDANLAHLRGFSNLQSLSLRECEQLTDAALAHLRGLANLRSLRLDSCKQLTDASLVNLRGLSNLGILEVGGCHNMTIEGIESLKRVLPDCRIRSSVFTFVL